MPSTASRFKRPTLLIVGCGDVGVRVARLLRDRFRIIAITSSAERVGTLRSLGLVPVVANLDEFGSLWRVSSLADRVLHLAPPPSNGLVDTRTRHLLHALAGGGRVRTIVYASTTGVYGNCEGAVFDETRPVAPATPRAIRRVDAETALRAFGRSSGAAVSILRVPGIYAADRPGGHPRERLLRGTPVPDSADSNYTNHIHADDLALACVAALFRGAPQRVVHASDDSDMTTGAWLDLAADLCGLPRARRIPLPEAAATLSPMQLSFLGESRRLLNGRLKNELGVRLRCPTGREGLLA